MKKLFVLSIVVLLALVGAQAFASPPIAPPVEGFIITTTTDIIVDGSMNEKQRYDWTYYDGWGTGPFFPNGLGTQACILCDPTADADDPDDFYTNTQGFSGGAQIAYQQDFNAIDGVTTFKKGFWASSTANSDGDNLTVDKIIIYDKNAGGNGFAKHTEKLGLSVIASGQAASSASTSPATNLLSLCPWAAGGSSTSASDGYPPTNEGIAAGSSFNVTNINFTSNSAVSSTKLPQLKYAVVGDGTGDIAAGFVVELFEGPKGFVWKMGTVANNDGAGPGTCYIPVDPNCPPPLASRTSYSEHADATGVWTFKKAVQYTSIMPGAATAATSNPIGNVP